MQKSALKVAKEGEQAVSMQTESLLDLLALKADVFLAAPKRLTKYFGQTKIAVEQSSPLFCFLGTLLRYFTVMLAQRILIRLAALLASALHCTQAKVFSEILYFARPSTSRWVHFLITNY